MKIQEAQWTPSRKTQMDAHQAYPNQTVQTQIEIDSWNKK